MWIQSKEHLLEEVGVSELIDIIGNKNKPLKGPVL